MPDTTRHPGFVVAKVAFIRYSSKLLTHIFFEDISLTMSDYEITSTLTAIDIKSKGKQ